jgi:hypothetical protein
VAKELGGGIAGLGGIGHVDDFPAAEELARPRFHVCSRRAVAVRAGEGDQRVALAEGALALR